MAEIAESVELLPEFEQIIGWFELYEWADDQAKTNNFEQPKIDIEQILLTIETNIRQTQKTKVFTDYGCIQHADFPNKDNLRERVSRRSQQPENSDRLRLLVDPKIGILSNGVEFQESQESDQNGPLILQTSANKAKLVDILKIHSHVYIQRLIWAIQKLQGTENKVVGCINEDGDTAISEKSWDAALLAAGATVEAVDAIMSGECRNAFCATRPPGHHAGIFGRTHHPDDKQKACSNGFCFINNVALGASYAMSMYRSKVKKVAIIDFDVHHGNGTQEIIEAMMKPKTFTVNASDCGPFGTFNVAMREYRPWLDSEDAKNVLFVSVHLFDNFTDDQKQQSENGEESSLPEHKQARSIFYPGTGAQSENTLESDPAYPGGILNCPLLPRQASSFAWRTQFTNKVFPRLVEFKPDFMVCSAGFDAHECDPIHGDQDTGVTEFDYAWLTQNLQKIANQFAQGRLLSVFEGGYNIKLAHISPLIQSVSSHVRSLRNTHNGPLFCQPQAQSPLAQ